MNANTIGLDLAKNIFHLHGADADGRKVFVKKLPRHRVLEFFANHPPCLVGMEACGSAHYWAREIGKFGHQVRLLPAAYVKPYVKRSKNDSLDAEAICEAVTRPMMRFVPVKSEEQQGVIAIHRTRDLLMGQRTQMINSIRGQLAEYGIIAPQGASHVGELTAPIADLEDVRIPVEARPYLQMLVDQIRTVEKHLDEIDRKLMERARTDPDCRRLMTIPGIGPLVATALAAIIGDPKRFASGRDLAAWIGLTPLQHSTGGKQRLGHISHAGDGYLRRLLIHGARAVMRWKSRWTPWLAGLAARRPFNVVSAG